MPEVTPEARIGALPSEDAAVAVVTGTSDAAVTASADLADDLALSRRSPTKASAAPLAAATGIGSS